MEDIRRLIKSVPGLTWLDVGKKANGTQPRDRGINAAVVTNTMEWATLLSELPDLTAFHGVKFFYEVSAQATLPSVANSTTNMSITDRSRIRKNDEVAGVLAWKCTKLRRLDYWEDGAGKIIVLIKDLQERLGEREKMRWEVRRVQA